MTFFEKGTYILPMFGSLGLTYFLIGLFQQDLFLPCEEVSIISNSKQKELAAHMLEGNLLGLGYGFTFFCFPRKTKSHSFKTNFSGADYAANVFHTTLVDSCGSKFGTETWLLRTVGVFLNCFLLLNTLFLIVFFAFPISQTSKWCWFFGFSKVLKVISGFLRDLSYLWLYQKGLLKGRVFLSSKIFCLANPRKYFRWGIKKSMVLGDIWCLGV